MAYLLTGVQHTTEGDAIMPVHRFESNDEWKETYHREMNDAISNPEFLGLGVKVFEESSLRDVFVDVWIREAQPVSETVEDEQEE